MASMTPVPTLLFVWENFGPLHVDRCEAVAERFAGRARVLGIELGGRSSTYKWRSETSDAFEKRTLFPGTSVDQVPLSRRFWATLAACLSSGARHVFLCHYEHPVTLAVALILRFAGRRVYVMNDSKYDDYKRSLHREIGKSLFYSVYCGGLASGIRSRDYLRFLGVPEERVMGVYNALSLGRIKEEAISVERVQFEERHFSIVARLVEKKNLFVALRGYALYAAGEQQARRLVICGSGPLEEQLREEAVRLGIAEHVSFLGFVDSATVCRVLVNTLALLLVSTEEQFGNAVIEAQALGIPAIVSDNCGVRDEVIRSGVNGFVVEPDNARGIAFFMSLLSRDRELWNKMVSASEEFRHFYSGARFAAAVETLVAGGNTGSWDADLGQARSTQELPPCAIL